MVRVPRPAAFPSAGGGNATARIRAVGKPVGMRCPDRVSSFSPLGAPGRPTIPRKSRKRSKVPVLQGFPLRDLCSDNPRNAGLASPAPTPPRRACGTCSRPRGTSLTAKPRAHLPSSQGLSGSAAGLAGGVMPCPRRAPRKTRNPEPRWVTGGHSLTFRGGGGWPSCPSSLLKQGHGQLHRRSDPGVASSVDHRLHFVLTFECTTEANHPPHPPQILETSCTAGLFLAEGVSGHPPQCGGCTRRRRPVLRRVAEGADGLRRVPRGHPPHLSSQVRAPLPAVCGGCGGHLALLGRRTPRNRTSSPDSRSPTAIA